MGAGDGDQAGVAGGGAPCQRADRPHGVVAAGTPDGLEAGNSRHGRHAGRGRPVDPDGHFLEWKPDSTALVEQPGMPWRLDPGNDLVLNEHLKPTGKVEAVRARIGLYWAKEPATKLPILVELEHDAALDIPAGATAFTVEDELLIPEDVDALAIYPHAHYLGKRLEGWAVLPGDRREELVLIPNWDIASRRCITWRRSRPLRVTWTRRRHICGGRRWNGRGTWTRIRGWRRCMRTRGGWRTRYGNRRRWCGWTTHEPRTGARWARCMPMRATGRRRGGRFPACAAAGCERCAGAKRTGAALRAVPLPALSLQNAARNHGGYPGAPYSGNRDAALRC